MSDVKPAAWMYPSVLATFEGRETFASAWSLEVTNVDTGEDAAPLYSQEIITALQAEIEALRKDAERWRALQRDRRTEVWTTGLHAYIDDTGLDKQADNSIMKESLRESVRLAGIGGSGVVRL